MGSFCESCGAAVTPGVKFCASCGAAINEKSSETKSSNMTDAEIRNIKGQYKVAYTSTYDELSKKGREELKKGRNYN